MLSTLTLIPLPQMSNGRFLGYELLLTPKTDGLGIKISRFYSDVSDATNTYKQIVIPSTWALKVILKYF